MPIRIPLIIEDVQSPGELITVYSYDPPQKSRNPNYDDVPIRGRSEPHVFYVNTDAASWNFTLHLAASVDQDDGGTPEKMMEQANFIESLILPDYGDSAGEEAIVRSPHLARIRILKFIDAIGTIRAPTWTPIPPYDITTGYPYMMDVSFTFQEQRSFKQAPQGYADVRRLLSRGQTRQA